MLVFGIIAAAILYFFLQVNSQDPLGVSESLGSFYTVPFIVIFDPESALSRPATTQ